MLGFVGYVDELALEPGDHRAECAGFAHAFDSFVFWSIAPFAFAQALDEGFLSVYGRRAFRKRVRASYEKGCGEKK